MKNKINVALVPYGMDNIGFANWGRSVLSYLNDNGFKIETIIPEQIFEVSKSTVTWILNFTQSPYELDRFMKRKFVKYCYIMAEDIVTISKFENEIDYITRKGGEIFYDLNKLFYIMNKQSIMPDDLDDVVLSVGKLKEILNMLPEDDNEIPIVIPVLGDDHITVESFMQAISVGKFNAETEKKKQALIISTASNGFDVSTQVKMFNRRNNTNIEFEKLFF